MRSDLRRSNPPDKFTSQILDDKNEAFDFFYKLIVIGDEKVGKTNLMLRICQDRFNKKPEALFGVEFEFRNIELPNSNKTVRA